MIRKSVLSASLGLVICLAAPVHAQSGTARPLATGTMTYPDLVELAESAPLVIRAQITRQIRVKEERAPGLAPGHARLYLEARTLSLIAGNVPVGESLRYLVDVPLTAKGKVPKLKKQDVILFARPVPGRPGEIQLDSSQSQLPFDPALEARLRPILSELIAPDAPPPVTGVAEALAVRGTLVGESETQLFLDTEEDGPVSISIVRRPGQAPRWGVSWSEIVDQSATAPRRNTLAWYRLACALPATLPANAFLSEDGDARALAQRDYAFLIEQLGPCERTGA